ncbi:acyltransferase [Arthrobacter sp. Leaf141]|uniref:acyltransferase n=1 Tax=Arthrobacter sp. Leaf141 TaxID=1736273 RepID=UPI00191068B2|nr:DapH/DapD/GlmU-related protein [Arthrobacter sp. Leaf141]
MTEHEANRSRIPVPLQKVVRSVLNRLAVGSNVTTGTNFRAGLGSRVNSLHGLQVGNNVSVGPGSVIEVDGVIGDFALIARNVQIVGRMDHDFSIVGTPIVEGIWVGDRKPREDDKVSVGRDVWIGAGVIVLGGVSIGEGSVIGAGSVVTKDIPPYSIAVGSPARSVGSRFPNESDRQRHAAALDILTISKRASNDTIK